MKGRGKIAIHHVTGVQPAKSTKRALKFFAFCSFGTGMFKSGAANISAFAARSLSVKIASERAVKP